MTLRVLDLFSGIGGFSLGLERTGGFRTVAFCEIDPYCRQVLAKHWPGVRCYEDVRRLKPNDLFIDGAWPFHVVCGGFPCQDISSSGAKAGIEGKRSGLWLEFRRLIGDLRPGYVIVENVSDILSRGLGTVLGDLAEIGYDAEWHCIPASFVGAPQARERVWIIAYANGWGCQGLSQRNREGPILELRNDDDGLALGQRRAREAPSRIRRMDDGLPNGTHRLRSLGNSVHPSIPELIGRAIIQWESFQ